MWRLSLEWCISSYWNFNGNNKDVNYLIKQNFNFNLNKTDIWKRRFKNIRDWKNESTLVNCMWEDSLECSFLVIETLMAINKNMNYLVWLGQT